MELQEQDIALLEAYLAGELAGEDLRACEARLQAEPALAEALVLLQDLEPATAITMQDRLRGEMKAAQAAAVAAGMASYTPAIHPQPTISPLRRLIRFLFRSALIGGAAWAIWKYAWHERLPWDQPKAESESSTTTHSTVKRDTVVKHDTVRYHGPGGGSQMP